MYLSDETIAWYKGGGEGGVISRSTITVRGIRNVVMHTCNMCGWLEAGPRSAVTDIVRSNLTVVRWLFVPGRRTSQLVRKAENESADACTQPSRRTISLPLQIFRHRAN